MNSVRTATLFATTFLTFALAVPVILHAEDCQQATAADVANLKANGVTDISVGGCLRDADRKVLDLNDSGAAKQDLQKMWCGNSNAQCTYQGNTYTSTIDGLDPKFAVCAAKFMKQLRQQDPGACIRSAYRSTAQQQCACARTCPNGNPNGCNGLCAPPGRSYHQKGLAIDVNHPKTAKQTFWQIASQSGLGNPTGLHTSDPDHIQAMNGGLTCADAGYAPTDTDVFVPGPASTNPYFNYGPNPLPTLPRPMMPPMSMTPSATPATTPVATTPTSPTTQPQICTPQFTCNAGVMYYQTSSCTTQIYQVCSGPCNGNSCTASTSTPGAVSGAFSTSTTVTNTNNNTNVSTAASSSTNPQPTSVSDILTQLTGYNFTPVDVATASPIAFSLDPETGDVTQAQPGAQQAAGQIAPETIYSVQPTSSPQTFTSTDLSDSYMNTTYSPTTSASGLLNVLNGMASALRWALNVLKSL